VIDPLLMLIFERFGEQGFSDCAALYALVIRDFT